MNNDEWYTPAYVFEAMGVKFLEDVASPGPEIVPWIPARFHHTKKTNATWEGFVWMNPPYGGRNGIRPWLEKFVKHGNGVCLTPDRASAPWWQFIAKHADAILFISPKIKFLRPNGKPGIAPNSGSCLFGMGAQGNGAILNAEQNRLGIAVCRMLKKY